MWSAKRRDEKRYGIYAIREKLLFAHAAENVVDKLGRGSV